MNAKAIRGWLLCAPKPTAIRVHSSDGQAHEIECSGQSWQSIAASVEALQPELVEALDAGGKLLRAMRPADQEPSAPERSSSSSGSALPGADAETQRFVLVAKLLAEAYHHSTEVAFARIVDLFDATNRRSESTERARESMYRAQVKALEDQIRALGEQPETTEGGLGLLEQMAGMFFGGVQAPSAPPTNGAATNGASNGAAKTNGAAKA